MDDNGVVQSVSDNFIAWSVGGDKYPSADRLGGGKWWNKCKNSNSISVELCDTVRNGKSDFTEATLANAAELVRLLMAKYNVPVENVIRHFDVVGKICPKPFVEDPAAWEKWKERLDEVVEKGKIIVNGVPHEVDMIRKDGTTYIKTRDIAALLGAKVGNKGSVPTLDK